MTTEINFLPESFLRKQKKRGRVAREIILVGVVAGCLFILSGASHARYLRMQQVVSLTEEKANSAQQTSAEVSKMQKQQSELALQIGIQRRLEAPVTHTKVLAALSHLAPPSITMTDVSMAMDVPKPTVKPPASKKVDAKAAKPAPAPSLTSIRMEIVGLSPSDVEVANFVGSLSENPLFSNVKMRYIRATRSKNFAARQFRIEMEVLLNREYRPRSEQPEGLAHAR